MTYLEISSEWPTFLSDGTLHEAYEIDIQSKNGETVRFVRHFFCIYDQDYVRTLAGKMHQRLLDMIPPSARPAQVIIIGCGDPSMIVPYIEETTDEFPIYSDPSGRIYDKLQMKRTSAFTDPPPYTEHSFSSSFATCLKQLWKRGLASLKGGNWDQQGGEWVFVDKKLRYAHRMEAANDHLTAEQLMEILSSDLVGKGAKGEVNGSLEGTQQVRSVSRDESGAEGCKDEVEATTVI
ncbi:hypothetical protein N7532_010691 [Penicillium argentinense]|uniref:Uncharacterized protein n=1 Tax=Penicillium argentinense TaxID=1131581 RepID=A0A9W9JYA4_9EURO|nr:uncharacterized protein N7532_010691 [Penicillium argentinense]KAJ5085920.1 hypothetical protein N7532_010691 [Penicillium argentinense]